VTGRTLRALVTVDAVGGVWQYGLDLARGLAERGTQAVLAVCGPPPDAAQRAEAEQVPGARLVETGLPLDWLVDDPAPVREAGRRIGELAMDLGADLMQLNMPTLAACAGVRLPTVAVTHGCVATWWEGARHGEALAPEYRWHRDLTGEGLRLADCVVAPSASYAATIARHYRLGATPQVVHNGRTPLVSSPPEGPVARVLTVGRLWDGVKRADLLDRVAARLDVPFNAAGTPVGPHGERVELSHLRLLGHLDTPALAQRLRARPVFVSAASFEPFGLAVLEAAQAGCALVLSDIDTFRELWDGAALFVPRGAGASEEVAYARTIGALLDDPGLRAQLGEAARRRAARYAPQAMADAMLAIYAAARTQHSSARRNAA